MQQEQLRSELNSLERKIKLIINNYRSLKDENSNLKSENNDLKDLLKQKDGQLDDFQNKIKISKIAGNVEVEEGEASELRRKIDNYIHEIDKCIAYLSTK